MDAFEISKTTCADDRFLVFFLVVLLEISIDVFEADSSISIVVEDCANRCYCCSTGKKTTICFCFSTNIAAEEITKGCATAAACSNVRAAYLEKN